MPLPGATGSKWPPKSLFSKAPIVAQFFWHFFPQQSFLLKRLEGDIERKRKLKISEEQEIILDY